VGDDSSKSFITPLRLLVGLSPCLAPSPGRAGGCCLRSKRLVRRLSLFGGYPAALVSTGPSFLLCGERSFSGSCTPLPRAICPWPLLSCSPDGRHGDFMTELIDCFLLPVFILSYTQLRPMRRVVVARLPFLGSPFALPFTTRLVVANVSRQPPIVLLRPTFRNSPLVHFSAVPHPLSARVKRPPPLCHRWHTSLERFGMGLSGFLVIRRVTMIFPSQDDVVRAL